MKIREPDQNKEEEWRFKSLNVILSRIKMLKPDQNKEEDWKSENFE